MPNPKRKIESFEDWYERNGGSEQQEQRGAAQQAVKPSQSFEGWYNAPEVDRLRTLASQTASTRRERNNWLNNWNQKAQQVSRDYENYNTFRQNENKSAVSRYVGDFNNNFGRAVRNALTGAEEQPSSAFDAALRKIAGSTGDNTRTVRYPYTENNLSMDLADGDDRTMADYLRARQEQRKANQAIENYNAWIAEQNGEPYEGAGDPSKGPEAYRYLLANRMFEKNGDIRSERLLSIDDIEKGRAPGQLQAFDQSLADSAMSAFERQRQIHDEVAEWKRGRAVYDEFVDAMQRANQMQAADYAINEILGREGQEPGTDMVHYNKYDYMSADEITEEWDRFKERTAPDLEDAKMLLNMTFAGVRGTGYEDIRDRLSAYYGIDAYDADSLQGLVDDLTNGKVYLPDGTTTTYSALYSNASSKLPQKDIDEITRLKSMSSSDIQKQYESQDYTDHDTLQQDKNTVDFLLQNADTMRDYPEGSWEYEARQRISEEYGVDPKDEQALQDLSVRLGIKLINNPKAVNPEVAYTDSNGTSYMWRDLYYEAENREQFGKMGQDEEALKLMTNGYALMRRMNFYNQGVVDPETAVTAMNINNELMPQLNAIKEQLAGMGYDFNRMAEYLDTDEAKQDYLMQLEANASYAQEHPWFASLYSVLLMPITSLEGLMDVVGGIGSGGINTPIEEYVPLNYYDNYATNARDTMRGAVQQEIYNDLLAYTGDEKVAKLGQSLYSGTMSVADSRMSLALCSALFSPLGEVFGESFGQGFVKWASLIMMGTSAAGEEFKQQIESGNDNTGTIMMAIAAGMNEVLFEQLSLDKLLEGKEIASWDWDNVSGSVKKIMKQSFIQRGIEGSEEVFTSLANMFAARLTGNSDQYKKEYDSLVSSREVSPSEANRVVTEHFFKDLFMEDFFGGFIAGGGELNYIKGAVMNTRAAQNVADAYGNYQQNRAYRNIGAGVVQNQNVSELVRTGQQSENEAVRNLANQVAENRVYQQPAEKPSKKQQRAYNIDVGKLTTEVVKENAKTAFHGDEAVVKEVIRDELKNRNIKPEDYVVDVIAQVYNNGEESLTKYGKSIAENVNASEIAEAVKGRADEIEAEASKRSDEAFDRLKNVQSMVQTDVSDRVSDTGEVIDTRTGKAVEIGEFVKDGDNITLTTKDGGRVRTADLQFANPTQAVLYDQVQAAGLSPEVANSVIKAFDGQGTNAANIYVQGMLEGMAYGRTYQTPDMDLKGPFFAELTPAQKDLAVKLGTWERSVDLDMAKESVRKLRESVTGNVRTGSVTGITSKDTGLNNAQRTGIRAIEMLVDNGVLKNNFHFFQSEAQGTKRVVSAEVAEELGLDNPNNDKYVSAPNGFYDPKTGDIYIDVNAGNAGQGTVLFTTAHELTHFVKQWSPDKFQDLASFLVEQYHGAGVNVDSLVRDQQQKGAKRNLSYDEAFEEMVADSMQTMFTDGNLATKLMALKERDKTLFDKMVDFVKKLQTGINKVYARFDPEGQEGKALAQIKGAIDNLADMFAEGITEATESYTLANAKNLSEADIKKLDSMGFTVANGLIVAKNMADIANRVVPPGRLDIYSYRTEPEWEKSVIAQWGDNEDTRRYINAVKAFTNAMVADDAVKRLVPMGSYAYETYGPLRDNQEYIYTFDMDTSCPRTFQFIKYRDVIQAYAKRPLTYNESVNLLELMRAYGQNIPCSYCYVENKRVLMSASYNNFFKFRNDVLNEKDANKAKSKMYGYNSKKKTLSDAAQKAFDLWRQDMDYNPTVEDIWNATQTARNSVFNFLDAENNRGNINIKKSQKTIEELVCDHFGVKGQTPRAEISGFVSEWVYDTHAQKEHDYLLKNDPDVDRVDVRALALNHEALAYAKSSSSAKLVSSYVPYTDQLKSISPEDKAYIIGMGGIRKHSSNDFRIDYVQDYLMFYADLAAGKWTGHTYTKSPDFVKIFGNTGDRINMSIAMIDGPNGQVLENELEGMYWKVAKELREAYKENVGVMSMVTSDAQLSYALNADWVDMIIPFHASSLDKKVWYDLRHWFDYTSKQLERFYSSKDMKLALIQKALDDAGVEYSSDGMKQKLIEVAREKGAGALSKDTDKIKQAEISRLVKLAAKNGVQFNNKMSTKEIEAAYNDAFGVIRVYGKSGKRIKPHFLPGETVVDGVTIPGHNNDVNKYLELCRQYGVHPRFDGVAVQDKNGNYINVIDHEGYLKLIKETARTETEQKPIQFNFDQKDDYLGMTPMEYALQQLKDFANIRGYENMGEDPMGIKTKFIRDYLGKDRPIGWLSDEAETYKEYLEDKQNELATGDVDELPKYKGNDNDASGYSYSIREIVDEFGTNYGKGVYLDSTRLDGKDDATRKSEIQSIVGNLGGQIVSAFDKDGNKVDFTIVDSTYFADRKGHNSHANRDLKTYLRGNKVKQESILLINEIATTSSRFATSNSRYTHGWLDNNGDGTWEVWKTYVEDRDGDIWRVGLRIAVAEDGTRYLYDLIPDKEKVGRSVDSLTIPQAHNTTSPVESQEDNGGKLIMSFRDRGEDITRGAYINNSGFDYRNEIESLRKKGETRFKKNSLLENAYKNNWRIALVESGTGNSEAYATTRIGRPEWISANDWEKRRKDTRVPKGSVYDLKQGESGKWYYPFVDLHVLTKPVKQTANSAYGAKFSGRESVSAFNELYEDMPNGKIRAKNVNDLSTEDWKIIYQVTKKLGYGIRSAADAKEVFSRYDGKYGFTPDQSEAIKAAYGVGQEETSRANPARVAAAKKEYGTTTDFREAGYILPDGSMLDFSGKREGGPAGVRYMDHREIARVFDTIENARYGDNTAYMNAFIDEGNIRLMDGQGVTIGETEPTDKQYKRLKPFIERQLQNEGYFYLDLSNKEGYTVESRDYGTGDTSSKIINDIKAYFKNGELPYRSEYANFRYSDRDPDAMDTRTLLSNALLDTAQNDQERKYIADYQAKIQQMNEEQNRLNEVRTEIKDLSFKKGPRDTKHLKALREEANKLANRINIYDKQLLRMESMKTMNAVVAREKQRVETRIKNKMASQVTDYRNKVASREYITRIEHEVKGLRDRLLHPKAKTVIPEAFARPVADFLSGIDFSTFYKDGTRRPGKANITRDKLRMSLEVLSNSLDENTLRDEYWMLDISPDMKQWIDNLTHSFDQMATGETFVLNQMSPEDLKNLYKTVVAIRTAVNMAGKLYTNMSSNVHDLALSTIDHLKPLSRKKHSAAGETLYKTLGWDYAQPVTAFERFGDGGKQIFNGLMKGQKQEAIDVQSIRDFADDAYTRDEVESWQDDLKEVEIGENTYNIPATYIMELYCMMKDKDAARHIVEGGGIRFDDLTTGRAGRKTTERFEDTFITDDEVKAMIGTLTDRQKEVADSIQEFMDRVGADWGNEISMTRYGYHAFGQIENYYPIKTVKQGSEYEAQQKRANIYALLNKSFTKERSENANNAVIIGDIFKTFSNHMSEMAVYHSWALPVIDTIKWFNYRESQDVDNEKSEVSVKNALRTAYGRHADEYIRRLLESINSQKSGGLSETLAFKNLRMVNRVAVAGNIRVAIQQPFSMTRAFEMLNPKYVRPMTLKTLKAEYAEMVENSSFGRWKGMGYYDVDISRPLEAEILKNTTFADRFTEKTMKPAEWGDQFTWATLWHGCKLEAEANGLTGEDAVKAAAEKFDQLIVHTQVVDSVLTKSQWMRSDSFWHRMTSAFMSEPMTSYNTLLRRFDQYQRDVAEHGRQYAVSHNWRNIAKTAVVFTLTQAVNALVTAPIDASRDDDDYKTWLEKMLEKFKKSFAENMIPTNMMPYIADIVDYMIYGSEDRADLAMYTRIIDAGKQLYNLFDQDKFTVKKAHRAFMTTLTLISSVTGLPMSNMTRDVIAMWNTVIGDVLNVDYGALKFQTAKDTNKAGYEQFVKNLKDGNEPRMSYIYSQMLSNDVDEDTVYDGVKDVLRGEYGSDATREETIERLTKVIEFFEDESDTEYKAEKVISWWDYMNEHPDEDTRTLNWSAYESYYDKAAPYGISIEQYETYYIQKSDHKKKEEVLPIIDAQSLTDEQKDALYLMNGNWSENMLGAAPWHQ